MHFLGAVIGGNNTSEAEAIIDPYSEYEGRGIRPLHAGRIPEGQSRERQASN